MELVVFDVDGTLLNRDSEIPAFTSETLRLLSQNDIPRCLRERFALGNEVAS